MKLSTQTQGVFPIAPTPFFEDGKIDYSSIDRLADFYVGCGSTGVTVLGQLGEAPKLSSQEGIAITKQWIQKFKNLPVIVGVSAPGFATMQALTHEVMSLGAAGVMIAPPNTLRTNEQIITYYAQAAEAIGHDVPIVLQDYPLTFSVQMSPQVIRTMVEQIKSIVMLKHEDWPGLEKISTLRGYEAEGTMRHISILCGNGGLFLDYEMARGADGANTGYCFPDMLCDVVRLSHSGQAQEAHDLFDSHLPLIRYEQQPNIGLSVRKNVMFRRGLISCDAQRKPGGLMSAKTHAEVSHLLRRLARHDPRAQGL